MNFLETLRTGLEGVVTHRLRSGLTVLGIMIGIAAVILTVGLGEGAQQQVTSEITALGSNLLTISPGSTTSSVGHPGRVRIGLHPDGGDAAALSSKTVAPDIAAVAPDHHGVSDPGGGTTNWTTSVVGTDPSWLTVRGRSIDRGSSSPGTTSPTRADVVVLGRPPPRSCSAPDPVGQTVTVDGVPMTVIGVLNTVGSSSSRRPLRPGRPGHRAHHHGGDRSCSGGPPELGERHPGPGDLVLDPVGGLSGGRRRAAQPPRHHRRRPMPTSPSPPRPPWSPPPPRWTGPSPSCSGASPASPCWSAVSGS